MKYSIEITPNIRIIVENGAARCENEVIEEQANELLRNYAHEERFAHPDAAKVYALAIHFGSSEIDFHG